MCSNCIPNCSAHSDTRGLGLYASPYTIRHIPELASDWKQGQHGIAVTYIIAPSTRAPVRADARSALSSACTVRTQCPSSIRCPMSSQCGNRRTEPLYPVATMILSWTITAPTCFRSHVDRVATWVAMFMKYVSQSSRTLMPIATSCAHPTLINELSTAQAQRASPGRAHRGRSDLPWEGTA